MTEYELLTRLAVSLAIGLLVGLERGWKTRDEEAGQRAAGFRTFALAGLLGGASAAIALVHGIAILGFVFLGFSAAFILFHWLEASIDRTASVTSVIAGMLTFVLGAYAVLGELRVAIAIAVVATVLLALREQLHRWVGSLSWEEIRAGLILLVMTFLLLPVLPDRTVDPWGVINPSQIWMLAILMAAISFGGYVAIKLFGERLGVLMAGAAGGLASSTATTLTLARLANEHPASIRLLASGALVAGAVSVLRVAVVAGLLNRALAAPLALPLGVAALVLGAGALLLLVRNTAAEQPRLEITNPLEIGSALFMAGLITVVLIASEVLRGLAGQSGVFLVAGLSGLADVDAVTISMARLGGGSVAIGIAAQAVGLALAVNTLTKSVMALWVGGARIGLPILAVSAIAILAGGAVALR